MPFESTKQRKFMYKNKPKIAKRWAEKYGNKAKPNKKNNPYKKLRA